MIKLVQGCWSRGFKRRVLRNHPKIVAGQEYFSFVEWQSRAMHGSGG